MCEAQQGPIWCYFLLKCWLCALSFCTSAVSSVVVVTENKANLYRRRKAHFCLRQMAKVRELQHHYMLNNQETKLCGQAAFFKKKESTFPPDHTKSVVALPVRRSEAQGVIGHISDSPQTALLISDMQGLTACWQMPITEECFAYKLAIFVGIGECSEQSKSAFIRLNVSELAAGPPSRPHAGNKDLKQPPGHTPGLAWTSHSCSIFLPNRRTTSGAGTIGHEIKTGL